LRYCIHHRHSKNVLCKATTNYMIFNHNNVSIKSCWNSFRIISISRFWKIVFNNDASRCFSLVCQIAEATFILEMFKLSGNRSIAIQSIYLRNKTHSLDFNVWDSSQSLKSVLHTPSSLSKVNGPHISLHLHLNHLLALFSSFVCQKYLLTSKFEKKMEAIWRFAVN